MVLLQPAPVVGRTTLRRLAHQLSRTSSSSASTYSTSAPSFICRQCLKTTPQARPSLSVLSSLGQSRAVSPLRNTASFFARPLSSSSTRRTNAPATTSEASRPTEQSAPASEGAKSKSKSFPETNSTTVAYWLLGSAVSVFGIVVWGGLTRLTESGYANPPPFPLSCTPISSKPKTNTILPPPLLLNYQP